jgi:hypothetical protein
METNEQDTITADEWTWARKGARIRIAELDQAIAAFTAERAQLLAQFPDVTETTDAETSESEKSQLPLDRSSQ